MLFKALNYFFKNSYFFKQNITGGAGWAQKKRAKCHVLIERPQDCYCLRASLVVQIKILQKLFLTKKDKTTLSGL